MRRFKTVCNLIAVISSILAYAGMTFASVTLKYDDGTLDQGFLPWSNEPGSEVAVRFTPTFYPAKLQAVQVFITGATIEAAKTLFSVCIYSDVDGLCPGTSRLDNGSIMGAASKPNEWVTIDVSNQNIYIFQGDFFVSIYWLTPSGSSGQNATQVLGLDSTSPIEGRSCSKWGREGSWLQMSDTSIGDKDAMIRAIMSPPVELPKTGQTSCYDNDGNTITCDGTGQDGDIQAGIDWPQSRFEDNGDGTITDKLTGLMWLKDTNCLTKALDASWEEVLAEVENLNQNPQSYTCGGYSATYSDWVLPNINELESLVNASEKNQGDWLNSQGFLNADEIEEFWSSTTDAYYTYYFAWSLSSWEGMAGWSYKGNNGPLRTAFWPVRTADFEQRKTSVWRTGQKISWSNRDDGQLRRGSEWPIPRFTDNGDGTTTDNLTGLVWLKDAGCLGKTSWQEALNRVTDFNSNPAKYSCESYTNSFSDWRLPNRKEYHSLTDFSQYDPSLPPGHPFSNVQYTEGDSSVDWYWSSTTDANIHGRAWFTSMDTGFFGCVEKTNSNFVWAVRGESNDSHFEGSSLQVNIKNVEGGNENLTGIWRVSLESSTKGSKVVFSDGVPRVIFSGLTAENYDLQIQYQHDDGQTAWEYWGNDSVTVSSEGTHSVVFNRYMPWVKNVRSPADVISKGENLQILVTLRNDTNNEVTVRLEGKLGDGDVISGQKVAISALSEKNVTLTFSNVEDIGDLNFWYWLLMETDSAEILTDHGYIDKIVNVKGAPNGIFSSYYNDKDEKIEIEITYNENLCDNLDHPIQCYESVAFYGDGVKIDPPSYKELNRGLLAIARKFERGNPFLGYYLSEYFDEDLGIYRRTCPGFQPFCWTALLGFAADERKGIYKELIWEAITSRQTPFLLEEYEIESPDGQNTLYLSGLTPRLVNVINELHEEFTKGSTLLYQSNDILKKLIELSKVNDSSLDEQLKSFKALNRTIKILRTVANIGLDTLSYIMIQQYLAETGRAEERLATLTAAHNYVKESIQPKIDSTLAETLDEIQNEVENLSEDLKIKVVAMILKASWDTLKDDALGLAKGNKLCKSFITNVARRMNLSGDALFATIEAAIKGISTYMEFTASWRRIHLSTDLHEILRLYARGSDRYKEECLPVKNVGLTYNALRCTQPRDIYDMSCSFLLQYFNTCLSLVEEDWAGFYSSALDGSIATIKAPHLYGLNYSAAALSFGLEIGKAMLRITGDDEIEAAKNEVEYIFRRGSFRSESMAEWAEIMSRSVYPSYVYVNRDGNCQGKEPCYTSIQDAISEASNGAAIRISGGTYSESLVLNESKELILQGGWDTSFSTQTPNTTFIYAPKATQGSLTLQMLTIKSE